MCSFHKNLHSTTVQTYELIDMANENWLFNVAKKHSYYFGSKKERRKRIADFLINNMLLRTMQMFEWKGDDWEKFSERIPQRDMELLIQTKGVGGIIKHDGHLYCVVGNVGGKPNWDYMPMQYVVANPYLGLSKTYNIYNADGNEKDVVIIPNDTLYRGVMPILEFHSEVLTEIYLTKRLIMRNVRMPNLLSAPDNNTKEAIDGFIEDIAEGEQTSIFDRSFLKNIESIPTTQGSTHNIMTQVLEMEQYQKAALFNDLGLQMNYNMKRETITSSEAQLGEGALLPLCDDMLLQRKIACKQIKEVFGLNIDVDFSSAWKDLRKSIETAAKVEESKVAHNDIVQSSELNEQLDIDSSSESNSYKDAVNTLEPIIEATREVIENIAENEVQSTELNEEYNEKTTN